MQIWVIIVSRQDENSGKKMRLSTATVKKGLISRGFDKYPLLDEDDQDDWRHSVEVK